MQQESLHTLISVSKILLDENRLKIVGLLANEAHSIEALVQHLDLKPSVLARQLAKLQDLGLVRPIPPNLYQIDVKHLRDLKKTLFTVEAGDVGDGEAGTPEAKILKAFLEGARLKRIPAKPAKLIVILNWLADKFEPGVHYPERTVNETLQAHHPDYASLRRYLVDYGLMQRNKGLYWRVETE